MVTVLSSLLPVGLANAENPVQIASLEQAWQIALQSNLSLKMQELLLKEVHEEMTIQEMKYLPTISATGGYSYTSEIATLEVPIALPNLSPISIEAGTHNHYDIAASIQQPLFTGFRTYNLAKSAGNQYRAQTMQKTAAQNQILLNVGEFYYEIQLNKLQQNVLGQAIERAGHHLENMRSFFVAQQATSLDTLEVSNRKLELLIQLEQLRRVYGILASSLAHLLDLESAPELLELQVGVPDMTLDELAQYQDEAIRNRPELRQAGFLRQAQSSRLNALRSVFFPQIYAGAAYHYARPGVDFFRDEWMSYYTVELMASWELWNWTQDEREVEKAQLELKGFDLQSRQIEQDIRQQVSEAFQRLQGVRDQVGLQEQLVKQEQEHYRITLARFEQARATSLDLSNAEKTLTSAELTLRQNLVEWLECKLQLQFALGSFEK
jgi:outer membrane protein